MRRQRVHLFVCAACSLVLGTVTASAQVNVADELDALAELLAAARGAAATPAQVKQFLVSSQNFGRFMILVGAGAQAGILLAEVEESRTDKQLGAGASASGTTSLVSKGGIPGVLALAVENGALARDVSGTVVTFRGTPMGIASALQGKGYLQLLPVDDFNLQVLSGLSFSASFDTSRGLVEGGGPAFTGDRQQLSQWTVRWVAVNHRNPARIAYRPLWETVSRDLAEVAGEVTPLRRTMADDASFDEWLDRLSADLAAAEPEKVALAKVLASHLTALASRTSATAVQARVITGAYAGYLASRSRVLDVVTRGLLVTAEYTNDRPLIGPTLSNSRFILEHGGAVELTGNASISWFNGTPPPGAEQVRDLQVSAQVDVPMGSPATIGKFLLSFAAKYQRLPNDTLDGVLPVPKGNIGIVQVKLTIPVKGSGVRIPVSLTVANRTESIPDKTILRGNVGLSYDLDALFARFRP